MKRILPFIIFLLILIENSFAQLKKIDLHSGKLNFTSNVNLDLLGPAAFYSFNYEKFLLNTNHFKNSVSVGASWLPYSSGYIQLFLPISVNQFFSYRSHHLIVGAGCTVTRDNFYKRPRSHLQYGGDIYPWDLFGATQIGYRFQRPSKRFFIQANYLVIIDNLRYLIRYGNSFSETMPYAELKFGYAFNFKMKEKK